MPPTLVKKAEDFLDKMDAIALDQKAAIESTIESLSKKIIRLSDRLEVVGMEKGPTVTLAQAQRIQPQLFSLFADSFGELKPEIMDGMIAAEQAAAKWAGTASIGDEFSPVTKQNLKLMREQSWEGLEILGFQARQELTTAFYETVFGQDKSYLRDRIKQIMTGAEDEKAKSLARYADGYAHDALMDHSARAHMASALESGRTRFLYFGNIIRDSRPFCVKHAGKVLTEQDIKEIQGQSWAGKKPGDFMINRGGYRCRHFLFPVDDNEIPGEEIKVQKWT